MSDTRPTWSNDPGVVPRTLALVFGIVYLVVGIVGFFITGFDNFASHTDEHLLWFEINPLHNVVHIVIGLAGIALASSLTGARTYGWLLFAGYGIVFVYGLWAVGRTGNENFLSINSADNVLHGVTALIGLVIALWPIRADARSSVDRSINPTL
ncbi:MAG: DUF4383 domain-containing protein [Actinomycetota bacterium]|nr:MAG: DUF4383 domain-containing protein [Actinomycetota bacterium]